MKHLWDLGFRPFFLLGGIYAVVIMASWIGYLTGHFFFTWPRLPINWHAHEMIYGFVLAIVSGFLLTASQNWSGRRGVHGRALQLLVALWLAARICWMLPLDNRYWWIAISNLIFYPVLLWLLKPYIFTLSQKRNWPLGGFVVLFFIGDLLFHLEQLQLVFTAHTGLYLGLYSILAMITVIGGRVIPFFTERAVEAAKIKTPDWLNGVCLLAVATLGFVHVFFSHWVILPWLCFLTSALHWLRWLSWDFLASIRQPILWVLYLGYAWMIIGFLLLGLGIKGVVPVTAALHALTSGAMGVLIFGMISRVSLGHTGRPILAAPVTVLGYVLINLAALSRVFGPIVFLQHYQQSLITAGTLWILAFILFVVKYTPILMAPRLDGKAG